MPAPSTAHRAYSFGEFTLNLDRGALLRAGAEVKLRPKSFAVLCHLVERHGRLVTKEELLDAIWVRSVVTEGSVTQCLIDIRRAIGDESHRMIRTVPRRGYLFDLPVRAHGGESGRESRPPAPASPALARTAQSRLRWALPAALVAILGTAAVWWGVSNRGIDLPVPHEPSAAAAPPDSIAVLPFIDMSPEQDQSYFSDGLSEEVLNLLAQIPDLRVIARTSSFSFKGQNPDIAMIAEKLDVSHVLEGSVRKSGDRVRITAQLVDASTSSHLWSKTYDRDLDDVFAVQDEIAASVADALKLTLVHGESSQAGAPRTAQAYEPYLQARFFFSRRGPGDVERARNYYQQALEIDPGYAQAWAGLAGAYHIQIATGETSMDSSLARLGNAVEQALSLDPDLAEAHVRAANYYHWMGQHDVAREHYQRALAVGPENPLVLSVAAGSALWQGRFEEAVALQRRAVSLDPLSYVNRGNLAHLLLRTDRLEEAKTQYLQAMALNPTDPSFDHRADIGAALILQQRFGEALTLVEEWPANEARDQLLAMVYHALGRDVEANAALERLTATPGLSAAVRAAEVYAYRGAVNESFNWLARAYDKVDIERRRSEHWGWLVQMRWSPFLKPLHADPRWHQWLADTDDLVGRRATD